jgi:hypothetical protein
LPAPAKICLAVSGETTVALTSSAASAGLALRCRTGLEIRNFAKTKKNASAQKQFGTSVFVLAKRGDTLDKTGKLTIAHSSRSDVPTCQNRRRNGLKIAVLAIFALCALIKSSAIYLSKSSDFRIFGAHHRGDQKRSLLHKFLHTDATDFGKSVSDLGFELCRLRGGDSY